MSTRVTCVCLCLAVWFGAPACGHDVTIGRYPADASAGEGGEGGTSGDGGESGHSGDGGEGGSHDECAEDEPVCGNDGITYMNACLAFRAGVIPASRGRCP